MISDKDIELLNDVKGDFILFDENEMETVSLGDDLDEDDIDPQRVVDRENSRAIDWNNRNDE